MASTTAPSTSSVTRAGVGRGEGDDRPGHRRGQPAELGVVDQRRDPRTARSRLLALRCAWPCAGWARPRPGRPGGRPRRRPGRATPRWRRRRRGRGPRRRATSQPSASATRDRQRRGLGAGRAAARPGAGSSRAAGPPMASSRSASSSLLGRRGARPGRPHHDLAGRPRRLEPHLAGRVGGDDRVPAGSGVGGQEVVGRLQLVPAPPRSRRPPARARGR